MRRTAERVTSTLASVADWVWYQNYCWHRWRMGRGLKAAVAHENIIRSMQGKTTHAKGMTFEFQDCTDPWCRRSG